MSKRRHASPPPPSTQPRPSRRPLLFALLGIAVCAAVALPYFLIPWERFAAGNLPVEQWKMFRQQFVSPDGRVIDNVNGNVSHSEGQGYGLVFAEAFGDRETFEKILGWTRAKLMVRRDSLAAWRWEPNERGGGGLIELNNASDGDLLIAWALHRAAKRWNMPEFAAEADEIIGDLIATSVKNTRIGNTLLPAQHGFVRDEGKEVILNPSYSVFPAFSEMQDTTHGSALRAWKISGLALCEGARFGKFRLVPDWAVLTGPLFSLPTDSNLPGVFGYNAIRVPLHLAWDNSGMDLLRDYVAYWNSFPPEQPLPAVYILPDGGPGPDPALPGMLAIVDFVKAKAAGQPFAPADVAPITKDEAYFSAALKLLVVLAAGDTHAANSPAR